MPVERAGGEAQAGRVTLWGLASNVTRRGAAVALLGGYTAGGARMNVDAARRETRVGQTFSLLPTGARHKPVSGLLAAPFPEGRGASAPVTYNGAEWVETPMLAVAGDAARAVPRPLRQGRPDDAALLSEMRGLLRTQGQGDKSTLLRQVLHADLDGDGREETLITAVGGTPRRPLAVLRYIVGGKTVWHTFVLSGDRAAFLRAVDWDGDERMEAVLFWAGRVGRGVQVWKFDGRSVAPLVEITLPPA